MNDWRGTTIVPGAKILYPARQGSSMWVVEAEVKEVLPGHIIAQPIKQNLFNRFRWSLVHIYAIERVTVIQEPSRNEILV